MATCSPCAAVRQLLVNLLLLTDKAANTLLLGNPNETLSYRFARAGDAGSRGARVVCRLLSLVSKRHCYWAEQPGSVGAELWHWSGADVPPELRG